MGIITTVDSAALIRKLKDDGWTLRSMRGSHHIFVHPTKGGHVTVPHPKKDLGRGLVKAILKAAGVK